MCKVVLTLVLTLVFLLTVRLFLDGSIFAIRVLAYYHFYCHPVSYMGQLYDTEAGEHLPEGIKPMPLLSDEEVALCPEAPVESMLPDYVARYLDMVALSAKRPCKVIGPDALLKDRPGFEIDFLTSGSLSDETYSTDCHEILMVMQGDWTLSWDGGKRLLSVGDTCAVPPGLNRKIAPAMQGEASMFRVRNTEDEAGLTGL